MAKLILLEKKPTKKDINNVFLAIKKLLQLVKVSLILNLIQTKKFSLNFYACDNQKSHIKNRTQLFTLT